MKPTSSTCVHHFILSIEHGKEKGICKLCGKERLFRILSVAERKRIFDLGNSEYRTFPARKPEQRDSWIDSDFDATIDNMIRMIEER